MKKTQLPAIPTELQQLLRDLDSVNGPITGRAAATIRSLLLDVQRLRGMYEGEREDAAQWLREEGIERRRADAAEAQLDELRRRLTALDHDMVSTGLESIRAARAVTETAILARGWAESIRALIPPPAV